MNKIDQTITELSTFPVAERIKLVEAIWDSLPAEAVSEVTSAQKNELDRRMNAHRANPDSSLTREELEQRVAKRMAQ
jgi:putative addiction module component (TIGR02574 family)